MDATNNSKLWLMFCGVALLILWPHLAMGAETKGLGEQLLAFKLNALVACCAGAYCSFGFGEKVEPRSKMYKLFVQSVIMGLAFTEVINWVIEMYFKVSIPYGVQAGIGAIISCMVRFVIPAAIERIGPWMDQIPFFRKKGG